MSMKTGRSRKKELVILLSIHRTYAKVACLDELQPYMYTRVGGGGWVSGVIPEIEPRSSVHHPMQELRTKLRRNQSGSTKSHISGGIFPNREGK